MEWRQLADRALGQSCLQLVAVEIEALGGQRPVYRLARRRAGRRVAPRRVIIRDRREPCLARLVEQRVENHRRAGQIIEDRVEPVMEDRQPVLDARVLAPGADRLVERILCGHRTEQLAVADAEPVDRFGV